MKTLLAALAVLSSIVVSPVIAHAQAPGAANDYANYVGTDPDAFIRSQLQRDENWNH